ncbi:MAG: hypothetical protein O2780_16390 [Proteobacteria bacterium]|nr:hypothetical protein [Pseudomonadota bacterium]
MFKTEMDLIGAGLKSKAPAFMEVLAARCAVRKTSRHDNGVPNPGTLRAHDLTRKKKGGGNARRPGEALLASPGSEHDRV